MNEQTITETRTIMITTCCCRGEFEQPIAKEVTLQEKYNLIWNPEEGFVLGCDHYGIEGPLEYYYAEEEGYEFINVERGIGYCIKYNMNEWPTVTSNVDVEPGINVIDVDLDEGEFEVHIKLV